MLNMHPVPMKNEPLGVEGGSKGPRARDVKAGTSKNISQLPVKKVFVAALNSTERSRAHCLLAVTNACCGALMQPAHCVSCLDFVHAAFFGQSCDL